MFLTFLKYLLVALVCKDNTDCVPKLQNQQHCWVAAKISIKCEVNNF